MKNKEFSLLSARKKTRPHLQQIYEYIKNESSSWFFSYSLYSTFAMRYDLLENEDIESAKRRRFLYIVPFLVYIIASFQAELLFLIISIILFSGFIWTMILCTLGMSSVMGPLTAFFIIDKYEGKEAIIFTTILNFIVFESCNLLCMKLDHIFDY